MTEKSTLQQEIEDLKSENEAEEDKFVDRVVEKVLERLEAKSKKKLNEDPTSRQGKGHG